MATKSQTGANAPYYSEFQQYLQNLPASQRNQPTTQVLTPIDVQGTTYTFSTPLQAQQYQTFLSQRSSQQASKL